MCLDGILNIGHLSNSRSSRKSALLSPAFVTTLDVQLLSFLTLVTLLLHFDQLTPRNKPRKCEAGLTRSAGTFDKELLINAVLPIATAINSLSPRNKIPKPETAKTRISTMADADTPSAAAAPVPVVFKKRAGKANLKKRAATPPSSGSEYSSEDESGTRVKRRRKGGITTSTSAISKPARDLGKSTQFAGDRSAQITNLDDATKTSNWFHADEAAKAAKSGGGDEEVDRDGTYKGAAAYGNFIQKSKEGGNKTMGPVKAPTNMRMVTLVDFAPDVCKDYKQTGFVSFFSGILLL